MITGNEGTAQLPMNKRADNVLAQIVKRNGIRRHFIDSKVVDYLLKKGKVKITKSGYGRSTHTIVSPVEIPKEEVVDTGGPYAKRKAEKEAFKKRRLELKLTAEEKLKYKIDQASEFYHCMKGKYYYSQSYPVSIEKHAEHIIGVLNDKPFYAKKPSNKKKKLKLTKAELTWLRIKAK